MTSAGVSAPVNQVDHRSESWVSDWRVAMLALVALWWVIYMAGLSHPPLLDDADSIHAEAAREMVLRHDWVTLHVNGIRYLEKAPLLYWTVASSYKLFGVSEWSTRLPLMLGVLATILATYALGRWSFGSVGGFLSGLVMATSLGPYIFTRFLIPDVLIGLWLILGYYFFLRSLEEEKPSRLSCWGFAATCALNVLTKGLIGLVFPAGAIGLYLLLTGNLRHILKLRIFSSAIVFLAIAAPWHVLAAIRNPPQGEARGFLWFYFINEHLMRFLNKRVPPGYDTVVLPLFWGLLLVWLFPWVVFLPQALRKISFRGFSPGLGKLRDRMTREQRANLLFFLWPMVILVFFSFSTRQEYYTIPAVPGLALLVGGWLGREENSAKSGERRSVGIPAVVLLVIGVIGFAAGMYMFFVSHPPAPGSDLASLLKKNPQDYDFSLGHVLDLTPSALGMFRGPLLGAALGLLFGTGLNWFFRRRGRLFAGNLSLAAMMVVLLACVHISFITFSPILSSYDLAQAIRRQFQPGDEIVIGGEYHKASTLNFYTGEQVHELHEPSGSLWYGAKFPDAPHIFETPESLAAMWKGPHRIFFWTDADDPDALHGMEHFVIAQSGGKTIYSNRPSKEDLR